MESLGRYRIVRQLGSGAFATVWLGHDDELDVPVAIKVLADNWTDHDDVRRRFTEEARTLRRIRDDRVVGVHDIGTWEDRPYFVMDHADAGTVADLVRNRPDRAAALDLAVQTARAVQVLHVHGVLHRDVKPSNLLLRTDHDGRVRVMIADLGTAKALAEASGLTLSAGTPAYMAPEQAHGQAALSARSDVYGAAAVAYALLTGSGPFPAERGAMEVARRDPSLVPASVGDAGLDAVLRPALSFDPDRRPATATALADQLERLAASGTRLEVVVPPARSRLLLLGLVVLVATAALTWLLLGLLD